MKRLPRKLWHRVHLLSIPMFVLSTVHGFTSGADNTNLAVEWVAVTAGLAVFLLVSFRIVAPRRKLRPVVPPTTAIAREPQPSEAALRGRSAPRPETPVRL